MSAEEKRREEQPQPGQRGGHRGPGGGGMPVERARDFKGSIGKLMKYISRHKAKLVVVVLFAMISTVFNIVGPKVLARATNELASGVVALARGAGSINFAYIGRILLIMLALYGISAGFSYLQAWIMTGVTNEVTYRLRRDISEKLHRIPLRYYEGVSQGEVLSRVTNDVDTINQSMHQSIVQIITSCTTLLGVLYMMLSISPLMTLALVAVVPLSAVFSGMIIKRSQGLFKSNQRYLGNVNGHIEETYGGQTVIRAFRNEDARIEEFNEINDKLYGSAWKSSFLSGVIQPVVGFIGNLGYVLVCILGAVMAGRGSLSLGDIQAFLQYVRSFNQPISQVANISNVLQQTAAAAERVFEFLGEEELSAEPAEPVRIENRDGVMSLVYKDGDGRTVAHPFRGNIEFVNVGFGYDPEHKVIKNFSAFVGAGQKVAIVGPTGAGKTTIVKLLMRFYDVQQGQILIDGHDIRDFTRRDLRSLFGMVLQDTWLYSDTIRENIRYGRRDAGDEEVLSAARAARVDHFVRTLPKGYDVEIDEETTNISAGQKQLITIARAVLADPEVLILDEATSSVDTKTEVDIQRAMNGLMEDRTSFVIAHRLSTIRDCDVIFMMKDGDIVEQGSHRQLIEANGAYAEMYNSQFESA